MNRDQCDAIYDAPMNIDEAWEHAQSVAHDPDALAELQADDEIVRRATRALTLGVLL